MKPRVLLAEPDDALCEIYARFFSHHGLDVRAATGGTDCMEKIALFNPDVVILDTELKWGGADGVLARLKDEDVSARDRIVLVTGDMTPLQMAAIVQVPVGRYFMKPVRLHLLLDEIQSALFEQSGTRLPWVGRPDQKMGLCVQQSARARQGVTPTIFSDATTALSASLSTIDEPDLEKRVRLCIASTRSGFAQLSVRADGTTIHLSGRVESFYLRQLAINAAKRVAGVQHVIDKLEVPLARKPK
jgi:DNA-binding response OmpR family regulator